MSYKRSGTGAEPLTLRGRAGRRASPRRSRLVRWPALALLAVGGCRSIGPSTVSADRVDYSTAVAESWKRQALLNIVKVRYMDTPIFVDVGQIVSGYSLETGLSAAAAGFPYTNTDQLQVQGSTKFTDRPTITYVPLTGNRFIAGLMTPIPPDSLFSAIQSGWPADVLLRMVVGSINGLKNSDFSLGGRGSADDDFGRVCTLMRQAQASGALSFRVQRGKAGEQASLLMFRPEGITTESAEQRRELGKLLGLEAGADEYRLVYGAVAANGKEVAVLTRSLLHVMAVMAIRAEVPAADVRDGRAAPRPPGAAPDERPLIRCSAQRPKDAAVAVRYRGHWFWIDDRDVLAKREFAFIMLLFTMTDTGPERGAPLITIPAQ